MKYESFNRLVSRVTVLIILVLYILFLYMDFYGTQVFSTSKYIKYSCIILCFLLSIFNTTSTSKYIFNFSDRSLLQWGMFITVIADLCLVIFNYYVFGIVFFSIVQIIYSVRYTPKKRKVTIINFFIYFLCIVFLFLLASLLFKEVNIIVPISLFYAICLLTSVTKAIKSFKSNLYPFPNKYMIVFGMILFLLCDICVALSNLAVILPLTTPFILSLQQIASFLIWMFYLPSQLLLALSGSCQT